MFWVFVDIFIGRGFRGISMRYEEKDFICRIFSWGRWGIIEIDRGFEGMLSYQNGAIEIDRCFEGMSSYIYKVLSDFGWK